MLPLNPEYIAGFFDGEGCIKITYDKRQDTFGLLVQVSNTDKRILDMISEIYGGSMVNNHSKNKTCYDLRFYGKEADLFLRQVGAHTIVKKEQVDNALRFLGTFPEVAYRGKWNPLPPELREFRRRLMYIDRMLKHGVKK